jgi:hypothetical protein
MRVLTKREQGLLTLCLLALFLMGNLIGLQAVVRGLGHSRARLQALTAERQEQDSWLGEPDPAPVERWLDGNMPALESAGKSQGELLQGLQDAAFERKLTMEKQNLLDVTKTAYYQEVSVNVIVRGSLNQIRDWLIQLQSPEKFLVIKALEISLDTKSKEKEPQARCNLTLARWFKPT